MPSVTVASLGIMALILLFGGGPTLTGAANRAIEDYEFYPGVGYFMYFQTNDANWTEAYEICEDTYGGQMAVPNSEAEAEVYKALIATADPVNQDAVFIGFHDLFVNGQYETIQGVSVEESGYPVWAPNSPNTIPQLRCGGFFKDGGLRNYNCAFRSNAMTICELPLWADYDLVAGVGHFKLHVDAKNWNAAWQTCRDEDSNLAVINSVEEYAALQDIFARHPDVPGADSNLYAYVGVHAKFGRGRFYTVHGTPLTDAGYSTWEVGQPTEGISNSYTGVALTRDNGNLTLMPLTTTLAFFCEHEL